MVLIIRSSWHGGQGSTFTHLPGQSQRGFSSYQAKHFLWTTWCRDGYKRTLNHRVRKISQHNGSPCWCTCPKCRWYEVFKAFFSHPCLIWAHTPSYLEGILTGWLLCWADLLARVCWANLPQLFSPPHLIMVSLIYSAVFIQPRENTLSSYMSTKPSPGLTIFL